MSHTPIAISPPQAWQLMQAEPRSLLVDVRSHMEFLFIGHPRGAVHVPWIDEPDWVVNPHFVTQVRQLLLGGVVAAQGGQPAAVLLICRSGKRSFEAGQALIEAGVPRVHNVEEGFEGELDDQHHRSTLGGWRYHGLPWEQC